MKKLRLSVATLIAAILMVGCGGASLEKTLTEGDGTWYLENEYSSGELSLTFESKDEVTIGMGGHSETVEYTISKKKDSITVKDPDDESNTLVLKVLKVEKEKISIESSGTKGTLVKDKGEHKADKSSKDEEEEDDEDEEEDRAKSKKSSNKESSKYADMQEELEENGIEVDTYGYSAVTFTASKNVDHDYFQLMINIYSDEASDAELATEEDQDYDETFRFEIENGKMVEYYAKEKSDFNKLKEFLEITGYSDDELIEFSEWYLEENSN
ncbi:hypothetical protein [Isobaculum melis]|uniref:Lipoprotein n=1 Tax=Isobaculum melis TaxID=142588 RepID=A0A1H9TFC7_9LACT|nr:hypothetical protein [Isobaculum melis]SER95313.1 hypothetical protein SAMN04488559_11275 [Isobaculum melis]